ncbi:hypothetical protein Scep_008892 [Stephania cephalantha]|uniref:Transcription initiation factor TFIID subunit 13 n=1 Tax=Stephania cephalantha TaxID=152367 RepID=A0AAP0PFS5_9MAGN
MHNSSTGTNTKTKAGPSQPSDVSLKRKRGMFQKDLQHMMYGFGDDPNVGFGSCSVVNLVKFLFNLVEVLGPLPESVALVEDIVVEYVTDMVHKAQEIACKRGKLLTEDFLYLIRKSGCIFRRITDCLALQDYPKLHRCTELLSMNEELKQARKVFDENEEKLAAMD